MENPYASPEIPADSKFEAPRLRLLAIFVGWISDIVFSMVTGIVLGIIVGILLAQQGIPLDQLQTEIANTTWVLAAGVLVGCCGTVLGGYVGAWMGKVWPIRHGFAVAMMSVLSGVVAIAFFPSSQPLWVSVVACTLAVPAGLLGGYLRAVQTANKTAPESLG